MSGNTHSTPNQITYTLDEKQYSLTNQSTPTSYQNSDSHGMSGNFHSTPNQNSIETQHDMSRNTHCTPASLSTDSQQPATQHGYGNDHSTFAPPSGDYHQPVFNQHGMSENIHSTPISGDVKIPTSGSTHNTTAFLPINTHQAIALNGMSGNIHSTPNPNPTADA